MFKYVHKNRKGVTLVELLVVIVVLGLVIPLAGQILYSLTIFSNRTTSRWEIQSAVKLACTKFETQRDVIVNSYEADMLYDPFIAGGIKVTNSYPMTFEWRNKEIPAGEEFDASKSYADSDRNTPYVTPVEGAVDSDDLYTYIFSTPAFDENDNYLGTYLFIRDFNTGNSVPFLENEGFGTVPINVKFSFTNMEDLEVTHPNYEKSKEYLKKTVRFEFESGLKDKTNFSVSTEFAVRNTNRDINAPESSSYNGKIMLAEWVSSKGNQYNAGPAGWVRGYPKIGGNTTQLACNYASSDNNGTSIISTTEVHTIGCYGNVLRFISPAAFQSNPSGSNPSDGFDLASCLSDWTFANTVNADVYLNQIRDFRDNVLKGTAFGDWFIHQYYYTWSPFLIEHTAFLKPVYKAVLIPVSYVCGFIARL